MAKLFYSLSIPLIVRIYKNCISGPHHETHKLWPLIPEPSTPLYTALILDMQ